MKAKKKTSARSKDKPLADAELSKATGGTFAKNLLGSFIPTEPFIPQEPVIPQEPMRQFKASALKRKLRY